MQQLEKKEKLGAVLDFGCGSGVMLPFLAERAREMIAVDIDLEPLHRIEKEIDFDKKIRFAESHAGIPPKSLDLIVALDV
jgi:methylase of polypeptide subunit release factors